jgi:hypothetical protein
VFGVLIGLIKKIRSEAAGWFDIAPKTLV